MRRAAAAFAVLLVPLVLAPVLQAGIAQSQPVVKKSTTIEIDAGDIEFEGDINWYVLDGSVRPDLGGLVTIRNLSGTCARVHVDFVTPLGTTWSTWDGKERCAPDGKKHTWKVREQTYSSNKVAKVKVTLQKKTASGYTALGSATRSLGTVHGDVRIAEPTYDFGSSDLLAGSPWHPGDVAWSLSGGRATAKLSGTLHIDNATSACARMVLTYLDDDGDVLSTRTGGTKCATDNSHFKFPITLGGFSDAHVSDVKVSLQSIASDGSVRTIGTDTSNFGGYVDTHTRLASGSLSGGDPYR